MDAVTTLATERMEEQEDTRAEGDTQNRCYPLKLDDTHQNSRIRSGLYVMTVPMKLWTCIAVPMHEQLDSI